MSQPPPPPGWSEVPVQQHGPQRQAEAAAPAPERHRGLIPPWTIWDVVLMAVLVLLVEGVLLPLLPWGSEDAPIPVLNNLLLLVVTVGYVAAIRGGAGVRHLFAAPGERPALWVTVLLGIGLGVLWQVADGVTYTLFEWITGPVPPVQEHLDEWVSSSAVPGLWALDIAGVTPVAEEVFFRGALFLALLRRMGVGWAALISSLVFGLAHVESAGLDSVFIVLSTGMFGFAMALLLYRRRSLMGPIAAHITANGIATVALLNS